jgi:hypothetical protein
MEVIKPEITARNKRCVYKMQFPDGSFYIGSTEDLAQRISGYISAFKHSIGSVNRLIADKVYNFDRVEFIIMHIVPEQEPTRQKENEILKQHIGNPILLNRSKSAYNNSGLIKAR